MYIIKEKKKKINRKVIYEQTCVKKNRCTGLELKKN